jgi:hypothetical protein
MPGFRVSFLQRGVEPADGAGGRQSHTLACRSLLLVVVDGKKASSGRARKSSEALQSPSLAHQPIRSRRGHLTDLAAACRVPADNVIGPLFGILGFVCQLSPSCPSGRPPCRVHDTHALAPEPTVAATGCPSGSHLARFVGLPQRERETTPQLANCHSSTRRSDAQRKVHPRRQSPASSRLAHTPTHHHHHHNRTLPPGAPPRHPDRAFPRLPLAPPAASHAAAAQTD